MPESLPKLVANQVSDGIQSAKQHDTEYVMTFGYNAAKLLIPAVEYCSKLCE